MEKKDKINQILTQYGSFEPVAVVGIGCRFPGDVFSLDDFWKLLVNKVDAIGKIPDSRFGELDDLVDKARGLGKIVSDKGGFLKDIDLFDASFFNISPKEAEKLDPQQRLLLEVAYEAIDDSTITREKLWGSNTGVFIGMWTSDWEHRIENSQQDVDVYSTTGSGRYAASGRISFTYNLQGTSLTLDTACSSSLVAMHLAVQAIQAGTLDMAMVGAVNLILDPFISIGYSRSGLLSSYGKCTFGKKDPGGYVRSEGAAMFLLKPLRKALEDEDYIHSIIRGSGTNSDGQSHNLMLAPSFLTQGKMIKDVLKRYQINPSEIQFIEAHGTGTKAGDSAEIKSIPDALAPGREKDDFFYIGSVKSNIGHTESASGLAGAIKAILAIKNRTIPPNLHFDEPNPVFDWKNLPLKIPTSSLPWPHPEKKLMAGVNSFGITGTNAHIVFMEAPHLEIVQNSKERQFLILPISAATKEGVKQYAQQFLEIINQKTNFDEIVNYIKNIAFRKENNALRATVVFTDKKSLVSGLDAIIKDEIVDNVFFASALGDIEKKIVFVFPGQGSQWQCMGKSLFESEPVFKKAILEIEQAYNQFVDWNLTEHLFSIQSEKWNAIDFIQPAIVAIEVALAILWESWGVHPSAVIGHSMGETASAYISGAISLDGMACIICNRSKLMKRTSGKGAMAYIAISVEQTQDIIKGKEAMVSIGVSNSPKSAVISGNPTVIKEILTQLDSKGIFNRLINVDVASHSPQMDELMDELEQSLIDLKTNNTNVAFYSSVFGKEINGKELTPSYWVKNLRNRVEFGNTIQSLIKTKHSLFIEMSPNPVLTQGIKENLEYANADGFSGGTMEKEKPENASMAKNLAIAWCNGVNVNWKKYYTSSFEYQQLPNYPWQKEVFWMDEDKPSHKQTNSIRRNGSNGHPLLMKYIDIANDSKTHIWETELSTFNFPYLADHKVHNITVFPAAGYIEMSIAAVEEIFKLSKPLFSKLAFKEGLSLSENENRKIQLTLKQIIGEQYLIEIDSINESKESSSWQHHFSTNVLLNTAKSLNLGDLDMKGAGRTITKEAHYQYTQEIKLPYEEAFQTIDWIKIDQNKIEANISAGDKILAGISKYRIHPAILDGCIQAFLLANYEKHPRLTFVPTNIEKLIAHSTKQPIVNCKIKIEVLSINEDKIVANGLIVNDKGELLLEMQGVVFEKLERNSVSKNQIDDLLYNIEWKSIELPATIQKEDTGSIVFCSSTQINSLEKLNASVFVVSGNDFLVEQYRGKYVLTINPKKEDDLQKVFDFVVDNQLIINNIFHFWSLNLPQENSIENFYSFQTLTSFFIPKLVRAINKFTLKSKVKPRLWAITKNAVGYNLGDVELSTFSAPLLGMGRTIDNEQPDLKFTRIDIIEEEKDFKLLFPILKSQIVENELLIRGEEVFASRLFKDNLEQNQQIQSNKIIQSNGLQFEAITKEPGLLSNIVLQQKVIILPTEDEVQVEVMSLGINFMNLMSALGIYPGKKNGFGTLGIECAGMVTKVGKNVQHLKVGDAVFGMAYHSMTSHINVNGNLMQKIPNKLTYNDAATIPVVFLTAYYGLITLGRLRKGERVLIHAATGGVGLSAIQIAQEIGAEVFATAGSEEKRTYLKSLGINNIYDSRSLDFIEKIKSDTNGKGVDIVLNSLTGAAMVGSLSLLNNFGRFIEIGKKDIYDNAKIGLEIFSRGLSYSMIDFEKMIFETPKFVGELWQEIIPFFENNKYKPLPKKVFTIDKCVEAFEYMSKSEHIGKIIVNVENKQVSILSIPKSRIVFNENASYLLTGGYGGLGLTFVKWMHENGAKHFILTGRSGPNLDAIAKIEELRKQGIEIIIAQADSSKFSDLERVFSSINENHPLKGILHLSGVLDDAALQNIEDEQFVRVLKPKVDGAFYLQELSKNIDLDIFLLFSSSTLLFGSPGQSAYCAANAYLDALSSKLNAKGKEAISINWGTVSDVGLAASSGNRGDRLAEEGVFALSPAECVEAFEKVGNTSKPSLGIFKFDPIKWQNTYTSTQSNPYFEHFKGVETNTTSSKIGFKEQLLKIVDNQELVTFVEEAIKEKVSAVLKMNPNKIDTKTAFKTLGIDSLMSIQLKNQLEKSFELSISVTAFWTYPNIREFAKFLIDEHELGTNTANKTEEFKEEDIQGKSNSVDLKSMNIEDISDDDISRLLADELNNL